MSHMIAVAFPEIAAADAVLGRLRSLQAEHLLELEDACVVQRDRNGHLHLKQAIGHGLTDALPGHFWRRIAGQIFGHNHNENRHAAVLDRPFVEQVSRALEPEMSALMILVGEGALEPLIQSLQAHPGSIVRAELPEVERARLSAALTPPAPVPSAAELAVVAERELEHRLDARAHDREAAESARRRRMMRLETVPLSAKDLQHIVSACVHAARQGEQHALVMRFPSALCTDGGRAINNGLPEWPATLIGQPKQLYEYYLQTLRPAGYQIRASIVDFPRGIPGDVGITLSWTPGAGFVRHNG